MTVFNANLLNGVLAAFVRRDLEGALAFFADDAIIFDPHYPVAEMRGKPAIRRGLAWALGNMEKPGFVIRHI